MICELFLFLNQHQVSLNDGAKRFLYLKIMTAPNFAQTFCPFFLSSKVYLIFPSLATYEIWPKYVFAFFERLTLYDVYQVSLNDGAKRLRTEVRGDFNIHGTKYF